MEKNLMDTRHLIEQRHINAGGQRLSRLAVAGQILLLGALYWGVYTLYMVQKPVTGMPLLPFLGHACVHGEFATANSTAY
jgi:fatty acid desaturase